MTAVIYRVIRLTTTDIHNDVLANSPTFPNSWLKAELPNSVVVSNWVSYTVSLLSYIAIISS